ncbi:hypothetical protein [Psychroserpens sp.]|nr:hypothetical protein [Psychroserpens sp.]MBO6607939.1 hypothetical protein [Psychroserpens sp.]MBO6630633.1 hypothetical protein [Psychroserpens sp.]MBO6654934.1 hypothetical protein [Psychroserpens sp.]MBO6682992.1 hypothetical protein [Psychroserpens sp.]MBO6751297.1 hypothetical protein [Psychroserpens sp.]
MKTIQNIIKILTMYYNNISKLNSPGSPSELILDPIYENKDDRHLFI